MNSSRPTLAVYGIQDRINSDTPFYVHDHGITLMDQGKVIKHLTLERETRNKHDNQLFRHIYDLLKQEGLLANQNYDLVFVDNVVGRSFISTCGRFRFEGPLNETLSIMPEKGRCWWLDKEHEAMAINHELAHLGSNLPFYREFRENSLLIHFDGGGSLSNFSAWTFRNGQLQSLEFHWDLKYLSGFFNANALVFGIISAKYSEQNSVPGKMMGLAAYGTFRAEIESWLVQNDYFANIWGNKKAFFASANAQFGWSKTHLTTDDPFLQDVVATLHHVFLRDFLAKIETLQKRTGADYLYYSGGSALNIVANTQLVESDLFKEVFIPPCPEDSGLSLGAAAYVEWLKHGKLEKHSPYLNNWGLSFPATEYTPNDIKVCADSLVQGMVIGICNGYGEIGPRALGNRSILALANSKKLADKVSMTHKKREWYRPVAPVMLEKNAAYYSEQKKVHQLGHYMLLDFTIATEKQSEIEGVVHVDGTARIQVISSREQNPYLFDLLTYLDEHHGLKALINTSFNIKGEPIVNSIDGAVKSARNMHLDGVVLNGKFEELEY